MSLSPVNDEPKVTYTAHAMLVPWGPFARQIGLVQRLEKVPIAQRKRDYEPQTKLIEFLAAIMSGCRYLQDISHGPHPLDRDQTVAAAWGQPGWADYSGVSCTLQACTPETVESVRDVVEEVSRPFVDRQVVLSLQQAGVLIYDGDLTGRPVSSTSTTYPGAAFGWMDDAVRLGYQAALVSLHSPSYGRLWLSVTPHLGDTVSCQQADALVRAAEAPTGTRPWRRIDLLMERIRSQQAQLEEAHRQLEDRHKGLQVARNKMQAATAEWHRSLTAVDEIVERDGPLRHAQTPRSPVVPLRHRAPSAACGAQSKLIGMPALTQPEDYHAAAGQTNSPTDNPRCQGSEWRRGARVPSMRLIPSRRLTVARYLPVRRGASLGRYPSLCERSPLSSSSYAASRRSVRP
jgi:hypothetical protein